MSIPGKLSRCLRPYPGLISLTPKRGRGINIARSHKPDVVLVDRMMPGIDGLTACAKIKSDQSTAGIPVVMVTAVGFELNQRFSKDVLGADGYITKPFDSQELLNTVSQLSPNPK